MLQEFVLNESSANFALQWHLEALSIDPIDPKSSGIKITLPGRDPTERRVWIAVTQPELTNILNLKSH